MLARMDPGALWQKTLAAMESAHPALFLACMVLLPLGPFPASLLFVAAGGRFGTMAGFGLSMVALAMNMTLAYVLAGRLVRGPLEGWIRKRGYRLPVFGPGDELRFLLLFRITPGMPLFVQNYVLGVSRIRFGWYLPVSLLVHAPFILGFVWIGQSLTKTSIWRMAIGVAGLVAVGLLVDLVRRRMSAPPDPRGGESAGLGAPRRTVDEVPADRGSGLGQD